jgi:hypothetical protein
MMVAKRPRRGGFAAVIRALPGRHGFAMIKRINFRNIIITLIITTFNQINQWKFIFIIYLLIFEALARIYSDKKLRNLIKIFLIWPKQIMI